MNSDFNNLRQLLVTSGDCYPTWTENLSKENWHSTSFLTALDVHFMAYHHWSYNLYIWIKLVKYNPANTRFWLKACRTAQNDTDTMLASRRVLGFVTFLALCCLLEISHLHSRKYCGFFVILFLQFTLTCKLFLDCMHFPLKHTIVNLAACQEKANSSYFACIKNKMLQELKEYFEKRTISQLYHIYRRLGCNFKLRNFILSLSFPQKPFRMISTTPIT